MTDQSGFDTLFAPESDQMDAGLTLEPWKVLVVDDEPDVHALMHLALQDVMFQGRPLRLLDAASAREARVFLGEHPDIALILLDVVMESHHAGLDLVQYVRSQYVNLGVQIILVTGQPGYAPEREAVVAYEINGYRLKSELNAETIFVAVMTALRTYRAVHDLEEYRENLECKVNECTVELAAAKDAVEAANRAKSLFLANMSHELRTPLNGVLGMTNLALHNATDPKLRDQLVKIDHASRHLLAVINDILDISKIEAARLTLERTTFRLDEILKNTINMIRDKAVEKGLVLDIDIAPGLSPRRFIGDPLRIGQILLNLTSNALKFTEQGSIVLRVAAQEETPAKLLLSFAVQDSGIGIAPEDQTRLFNAFEQADGSMTRKYGGTGLGLAISKRLVEMMGGEIGFDSAPGKGSTFWFHIWLEKAGTAAVQPAPTVEAETMEDSLRQLHRGARILLAEDEPISQEVARGLLEDVGLAVDLADDGAAALALARQNHYDLILLDMQMPKLNGVDAAREIRADSLNREVPILSLTANAFVEDRQVCLDAGMNDHLAKPIAPEVLYAALLKCLKRK